MALAMWFVTCFLVNAFDVPRRTTSGDASKSNAESSGTNGYVSKETLPSETSSTKGYKILLSIQGYEPIHIGSGTLAQNIKQTKSRISRVSSFDMEKFSLDPSSAAVTAALQHNSFAIVSLVPLDSSLFAPQAFVRICDLFTSATKLKLRLRLDAKLEFISGFDIQLDRKLSYSTHPNGCAALIPDGQAFSVTAKIVHPTAAPPVIVITPKPPKTAAEAAQEDTSLLGLAKKYVRRFHLNQVSSFSSGMYLQALPSLKWSLEQFKSIENTFPWDPLKKISSNKRKCCAGRYSR